jgi:hypothetical protein
MNNLIFADRLTTAETANILGIVPGTLSIWRCTKRYNLPYVKVGARVYYKGSDVKKFIADRTVDYAK